MIHFCDVFAACREASAEMFDINILLTNGTVEHIKKCGPVEPRQRGSIAIRGHNLRKSAAKYSRVPDV